MTQEPVYERCTREYVLVATLCEYCINSHSTAVLRLGLDKEGLGEVIAVTDLFNGMNRIANGYQIEPDIKPSAD